jgi:multiple sugar transport system substrate-binding protein
MQLSRKGLIFAFLALVCAAFAFAGPKAEQGSTTGAASASGAPVEITYMQWYNTTQSEGQEVQVRIDQFNASQNRVKVTLIIIPRDGYETKVNTMAAAGQLPDTTMLSEAMAVEFAANNLLADVGSMYPPGEGPLKSLTFTYNGTPVAYSSGNVFLGLYYNKKLFDEARLPYPPTTADKAWTWDQFIQVARKLTKDKNGRTADQAGFDANNIVQYGADFNRLWWMWPIVTYSNGGGLISPDGKQLLIGKPESIEAMQKLADLYIKEKVAPSVADKGAMPSLDLTLLTGKVAMATSGHWEMGVTLKNSLPDGLSYGFGVLPKMKTAVTYNTGGPFAIFKSTKNLDACMEFMRWWSDDKAQWSAITGGIMMPANAKWYKDEATMRQWADMPPRPPFAEFKGMIDYAMNNAIGVPWYYFNGYQGLTDILESGIDSVWNGKTTAKDYINSIMPRLQKYFDEHKAP